jgi:hypothetical protein
LAEPFFISLILFALSFLSGMLGLEVPFAGIFVGLAVRCVPLLIRWGSVSYGWEW